MNQQLPQAAAAPLAYALALDAAKRLSIRALAIKGPVTTAYGFGSPKVSSDADVVVEEEGLRDYISELERLGWQRRPHWYAPALFPAHSLTMFHSQWPVDIDVHVTFPGCFGSNADFFNALWKHRERLEIAGVECLATDGVATAFIALLHALRHPGSARHRDNHKRVLEVFESRDSFAEDLGGLVDLAVSSGAVEALADDFSSWGVQGLPGINEDNQKLWQLYTETHEAGSLAAWIVALRKAPLRDKPETLMRALVPAKNELQTDLKTADLKAGGRMKFVFGRLVGSFGQVKRALRALRRHGGVRSIRLYPQEPEAFDGSRH